MNDDDLLIFDRGLQEERDWWVRTLGPIQTRTELRSDGEADEGRAGGDLWAHVTYVLPGELASRVHSLCSGSDPLIYTVLWVAISECLRRMNPAARVVIGSPSLSGPDGGTANVIAVPAVAELEGGRFKSVLAAQQEALNEAHARHRYPFTRLLKDLGHPSAPVPCPLFGVALASSALHGAMPSVGHDVTIVIDAKEKLALKVDYLTDRYARTTIERFTGYVGHLLAVALEHPDQPLDELPIVDSSEERRLLNGWEGARGARPTRRLAGDEQCGLTSMQLLVWIADRLSPEAPLHNMATLTIVEDAFDKQAFTSAWDAVVAGNDALRTVVRVERGEPRAIVMDSIEDTVVQLSGDTAAGEEELLAWAQARLAQPLDTSRGVFDCVILTLGPERWAWYLNVHHIATDGVSNSLILQRTGELYAEARTQAPPRPRDWPSFADVVTADWRYQESGAGRESHAFWVDYLSPPPPAAKWFDRQARRAATRLERHTLCVPQKTTLQLLNRTAKPPFAMFNVNLSTMVALLSAAQSVIHKFTGLNDVSVGVVFHNRRPRTAETVGLVMQVAPVRNTLAAGDSFADLADRNVTEIRNILPHISYAMGNPGGSAHYDVLLNVQTAQLDGLASVVSRSMSVPSCHGHEALSIEARFVGDELIIDLDMHTEVFQPTERQEVADFFSDAIDAIAKDPGRSIDPAMHCPNAQIPRFSTDSQNPTVLDLFAAQVEKQPKAVAADMHGDRLTYEELLWRAEMVARDLENRGPVRHRTVAICARRSPDFLAGVLGILLAGATCLPLDPAEPPAWLSKIRQRTEPVLTLFEGDLRPGDTAQATRVPRRIHPEQIAFTFFTSGSTGSPKSVDVRHGALARYTRYAAKMFGLDQDDRMLQFAKQSSDTFCEEVFSTLFAGGTLVIVREPTISAPTAFLREVHAARVTVLDLPTAYWHELADGASEASRHLVENVRLVVLGGEKVDPGRLHNWRRKLGSAHRVLNTYGPTEATVVSTSHLLTSDTTGPDLPIGRGVKGAAVYVLDSYLRPSPIGIPGELHIGGSNLARGYRDEPRQTAERFIPDPFSREEGARMYRTGDSCYWLADGTLAFLHRMDRQLKIQGHRVEPAEVRQILMAEDLVLDAEVAAVGPPVRLAAYVVPAREPEPGWETSLRANLLSLYPPHLIPSVFVAVAKLTRDADGTIQGELPPVATDIGQREGGTGRPLTPAARKMAEIWCDVLDVATVGARDNFFDLGGHSLLAVRTMARVLEVFGVEHPLRVLFDHPELADFTSAVGAENILDGGSHE